MERRKFIQNGMKAASGGVLTVVLLKEGAAKALVKGSHVKPGDEYDWEQHNYVFLIDILKCIGCTMCVRACKRENDVPDGYVRTWVERYHISGSEEVIVDCPPDGGYNGYNPIVGGAGAQKAFFVPKLCNHCEKTPCIQVCPVGASYHTKEGVVMVDAERCIGCGYCVQACPYGSRFIHPVTHTASKCTWCYHRITKGLKNACVEACPRGVRMFGDMNDPNDPVRKILLHKTVQVLQPELMTEPQCFYLNLDKEVR